MLSQNFRHLWLCYVIKLHILEWSFVLMNCCAIIMFSNQDLTGARGRHRTNYISGFTEHHVLKVTDVRRSGVEQKGRGNHSYRSVTADNKSQDPEVKSNHITHFYSS